MKPPRILALAIVIHQLHNVVLQWVNNKLFLFQQCLLCIKILGYKAEQDPVSTLGGRTVWQR